jgi:hypothetical protein
MLLLFASVSHAHEGHDHGDEAPLPVSSVAPRFEARSDLFELVGILDGKVLWLYLDKADSNEPIEQASIEIESGSFKGKAVASPGGVFKLMAPALAQPGQHALTITVEAGEDSDLLTASLEMKAADIKTAGSTETKEIWPSGWLAYAAVAIVLALLIVAVIRMRKGK